MRVKSSRWWWGVYSIFLLIVFVACNGSKESSPSAQENTRIPSIEATLLTPLPAPFPTLQGSPTPSPTLDPNITPSPTPCPTNPEWREVYTVRLGDTLGEIALAAGTTIEEIAANNCLTNINALYEGQELLVPQVLVIEMARSPEGTRGILAFIRQDDEGNRDLWTVRSDGNFPLQITETGDIVEMPVRSNDLNRLAFRRVAEFQNRQGQDINQLPNDIWVINLNGTQLISIAGQGPTENRFRSLPVWSPDDALLAFTEQDPNSNSGSLVVIQSDGTRRVVVLTGDFIPPDSLEPIAPTWSLDGTQLIYVTFDGAGKATLHLIQADGSDDRVLIAEMAFAKGLYWVPWNGLAGDPALAYAVYQGERFVWYVIDTTTGEIALRAGGLALVHPYLAWQLREQTNGWGVYQNDILRYVIPVIPLEWITWSPEAVQLIYPTEQGLLRVDFEATSEEYITEMNDSAPVWTHPLWVVLP